jgi:hypothetical protein
MKRNTYRYSRVKTNSKKKKRTQRTQRTRRRRHSSKSTKYGGMHMTGKIKSLLSQFRRKKHSRRKTKGIVSSDDDKNRKNKDIQDLDPVWTFDDNKYNRSSYYR